KLSLMKQEVMEGWRATKDMGKMLGGDEEKDPDAAKKEEERQEALRQEEEERKAKYAKMEAEREVMRQGIRDKVGVAFRACCVNLGVPFLTESWYFFLC
uniref:Complexin-1 n=1 Tax=Terrapene triunguis TaxID=2587831 RepID=A0A674JWP6_9SAUR